MGTLRLVFALCVLILHSGQIYNNYVLNSTVAVSSFFIISGFYMALILDNKYSHNKKNHTFLFWSNRFLRIFPLYWITLLITFFFTTLKLLLHVGTNDNAFIHYLHWAPHTSSIVFGLDLFNYILRNITLLITIDYVHTSNNLPGYLLVQQAWTLQIELLFYLLAPFLAQLRKKLFLGVFIVYMIGFWGIIVPLHLLPPTLFNSFLRNLVFFFLGMMSYRFMYKNLQLIKLHPHITRSVFFAFLIYLLFYNLVPYKFSLPILDITDPVYYILLMLSLPLIFFQTSTSLIDNLLGKFSYPIYILHFFILKLFSNLPFFKYDSILKTIIVIVATLIASYLAIKFIETPINQYRQKRINSLNIAS
jgi:peptidoglycan/LPS O-acetylase OafA/YrhL